MREKEKDERETRERDEREVDRKESDRGDREGEGGSRENRYGRRYEYKSQDSVIHRPCIHRDRRAH